MQAIQGTYAVQRHSLFAGKKANAGIYLHENGLNVHVKRATIANNQVVVSFPGLVLRWTNICKFN